MTIAGLQKMTLLDYPGKVACTVFLQGCNFRCPFCHNSGLLEAKGTDRIPREELLRFLQKRVGLLEGVCVTGGEPTLQPEPVPDYIRFPQMEMPIVEVEGHGYIGTLCIPDLGLELPVMSEWSYPKLKIAPCRFTGSAYQDDLIIVAHNYVTHLRNIKTLPAGAEVTFTDMAGNVFCYALAEIEILKPDQVEELMGTDYPLTLVTCTIGGRSRVTVYCDRAE